MHSLLGVSLLESGVAACTLGEILTGESREVGLILLLLMNFARALTFLSNLGSPEKLFLYNALIGASWGTGAILGPVVGGAFSVSAATWRWVRQILPSPPFSLANHSAGVLYQPSARRPACPSLPLRHAVISSKTRPGCLAEDPLG